VADGAKARVVAAVGGRVREAAVDGVGLVLLLSLWSKLVKGKSTGASEAWLFTCADG